MSKFKLAIVVPCYNEQEALPSSIDKLCIQLENLIAEDIISKDSFNYFVDDGSTDKTWEIIEESNSKTPSRIKGMKFIKNFGNQNAIIAGLEAVHKLNADAAIIIDADLQQDESKIKEFIEKHQAGADIVCGVRKDRCTDNILKKTSALLFYNFMNAIGVKIKSNHSEYRLVSKKTIQILSNYNEINLFLRGLFYELGLKTDYVYFDVKKREHGKTKFSNFDLMRLAVKAITSFSSFPLKFVFITGLFLSGISILIGIYALYAINYDKTSIFAIEPFEIFESFLAGIQIFCIGIIGAYIGQVLKEVKYRPRYIKDKELN